MEVTRANAEEWAKALKIEPTFEPKHRRQHHYSIGQVLEKELPSYRVLRTDVSRLWQKDQRQPVMQKNARKAALDVAVGSEHCLKIGFRKLFKRL